MPYKTSHSNGFASAAELALRVLFGEEFAAAAEPDFVESLVTHQHEWGAVLQSIWSIAGGTPIVTSAIATLPAKPTDRALAVPASGHEGNGSAPAMAQPAAVAEPAPAAGGVAAAPATGVVVFNPSDSDPADEGPTRDRPWKYEEVRDELVALFEESTGYPASVLEDDADLEADLAIDSVKQVEALGKLRERYQLMLEDTFAIRDYRTIRTATTYLVDRLNRERLARRRHCEKVRGPGGAGYRQQSRLRARHQPGAVRRGRQGGPELPPEPGRRPGTGPADHGGRRSGNLRGGRHGR